MCVQYFGVFFLVYVLPHDCISGNLVFSVCLVLTGHQRLYSALVFVRSVSAVGTENRGQDLSLETRGAIWCVKKTFHIKI
jgi:predicted methyltransferase MtxX (methanogen marker protein 4)